MSQRSTTIKSQAGFTLVELAIVMIIIGLLIGGVLKGQELIGNAQVTATIAQIKSFDAATTTFKDTYAGLPGDITNATNRLPNCAAAPCSNAGNGDGRLANTPATAPAAGAEGTAFFPQLATANLVTGIVPSAAANSFGQNLPAAKISGNGFRAGSSTAGAVADFVGVTGAALPATGGLWLALTSAPATDIAGAGEAGLKPTEAFRIDTKMDDGSPNSGITRAFGGIGANNCADVATNLGIYNTNASGNVCGLYTRIQG